MAGDCPPIDFDEQFFVPVVFVQAVNTAIEQARGRPAREVALLLHDAVYKHCAHPHAAASGYKKTKGETFDDNGLMALVCRHDIVIYMCNIVTAGEQSVHPIALYIWFRLHMPVQLMMSTWYDINCQTAHTLELVRVVILSSMLCRH